MSNYFLTFFSFLILFCALASCSNKDQSSTAQYEWNIWLYLDGDNDLSDYIQSDYEEIVASINSDNIHICIQLDLPDATPTRRTCLLNGKIMKQSEIGEVDMASAESLTDFLVWSKAQGTANKTLLILSDHGNGWDQSTGPSPAQKTGARALFSDSDNGKAPPYVYLHNHLVADAIKAADVKLDILGFDASLMATIETMYEFSDLAPILIASEEIGNPEGWNYSEILSYLENNQDVTSEKLSRVIVDSYQQKVEDFYANENTPEQSRYYGLAAFHSDGIKTLAETVNTFANDLQQSLNADSNTAIENIINARSQSEAIDLFVQIGVYVDLKDFFALLGYEQELDPIYQQMIIKEYHGPARANANGLSIVFFMPDVNDEVYNAWDWNTVDYNYKNWDAATASGNKGKFINEFVWDELLAEFYQTLNLTF